MELRRCRLDEFDAVALASADLSAVVVPDLGGKLASIVWAGREVLAQNRRKPLRPARYAAPFADFDASGFDECLPTIGPCSYPEEPWQGTPVPDHGEVWSIPWSCRIEGQALRLRVDGVRFPYSFEKTVELRPPGRIRLDYTLTNRAPAAFKFVWSAHPLLAPRPGMRIHLPPGTGVRVDWSKGDRLGGLLAEHPWPLTRDRSGNDVDLGLVRGEDAGLVDKLYTTRLSEGWCAVHDPDDGFLVAMRFPPDRVPYVGLSINLGGWPIDAPGYYNLGLEPCNGYPDRLDVAIARGACAVAPPGGRLEWWVELQIGRTADVAGEIVRLRAGGDTG